jgi:hypothetical protein
MNKLLLNGILMAVFVIIIASCQYKFTVEPVPIPPDPEDTISFAQQIVPIWDVQNCISCHNTGGQNPDLTADNAYNSITTGGFVETADPSTSIIYHYPLPTEGHYLEYTATQALLVLTWIEQGAHNN